MKEHMPWYMEVMNKYLSDLKVEMEETDRLRKALGRVRNDLHDGKRVECVLEYIESVLA